MAAQVTQPRLEHGGYRLLIGTVLLASALGMLAEPIAFISRSM